MLYTAKTTAYSASGNVPVVSYDNDKERGRANAIVKESKIAAAVSNNAKHTKKGESPRFLPSFRTGARRCGSDVVHLDVGKVVHKTSSRVHLLCLPEAKEGHNNERQYEECAHFRSQVAGNGKDCGTNATREQLRGRKICAPCKE